MKHSSKNLFVASLSLAFASFTVAVSADTVTTSWDYYTASGSGDTSWVAPASTTSVLAIDWGTGEAGTATTWGGIDWVGSNANASYNASGSVKTWYSQPNVAWGSNYGDNTFYPSSSFPLLGSAVTGGDNHILEIRDLNPGQSYKIQFVLADSRAMGAPDDDRSITLSGVNGTTGLANNYRYGYSDGQYAVITANVIADAAGYAVFKPSCLNANGSIGQQINAMQVLAVNNPSLSWTIGDGTWSATDLNWTGGVGWTDSSADATFDNAASATAIAIDGTQTAATVLVGNGGNNALYAFNGGTLNADALIVQGAGANEPGTGATNLTNVNLNTVGDVGVGRWDLVIGGSSNVTIGGKLRSTSDGNGTGDWGRVTIQGSAQVTATGGVSGSGSAWGLTLDGATLTTPSIRVAENAYGAGSRLTLKGGATLVPSLDNGNFIVVDDSNRAFVGAGGAKFDTNGKNISVGINLVDDGGGSITKMGAGTLTLTGSCNYSGGTFVNDGKLVLQSNSGVCPISGAITINANGTVETIGDGSGLGYYDQISSVTINGGTLTSAGAMHLWNISGGITMTGGSLNSNSGTSNANGPQLEWNRANLNTLASADTATIGGRIRMRDSGGYTGITFDVADGAAATDLLVSAAITEASSGLGITKAGAGAMLVTGAAAYSGPTTISSGTLQFGDGVSGGSIASSAINNNASLVLHPAVNVTFPQVISGTGSLTKLGSSTLSLTGSNTYTGDTVVDGGTLELLNNSTSVVQATVTNAGFETPDYSGGGWGYLNDDGIVAWSFSAGGIGSNGSPWLATAPEGDQAGFIQINGSISQTITVATSGDYVVRFMAANRPGYTASDMTVSIDATQVGAWSAAQIATGGNFAAFASNPISLTPGTYTLTFTGTGSGDTATAIDAVSVSSPPDQTSGSLTFKPGANGSSNKITGSGAAVLNGQLSLDLSAAAVANGNSWTLVNHATLNESYGSDFSVTSSLGAFTESPAGTWKRVDGNNTWTFTESTGELTLAVASADPFEDWMATNYPGIVSPNNQPGADPDSDGIKNLVEYVLQGGDPSTSNPDILPTMDASGANFVFTFYRRADATGTTQVFEYGTDLSGWTPVAIPGGSGVTVTDQGGGIDKVEISVAKGSNTKLFGRLQVTK